MKVNFSKVLTDIDGAEMKNPFRPDSEAPLTLRDIAVRTILQPIEGDKVEPVQTLSRLELARRIQNSDGELEIRPEDAVLLRERSAKMYGVLISGQVYESLGG